MRFRSRLLFAVLLLVSVPAFAQVTTLNADLAGSNEVPPCDLDGSGTAQIQIIGTTVNYTIVVNNITLPPVAQHIHQAPAGVNGPIVINLPGVWVGNTLVGSTTASAATINAIIANPAGFYVNVHTNDCPGGAVRGQLALAPTVPALTPTALAALALLLAVVAVIVMRKL